MILDELIRQALVWAALKQNFPIGKEIAVWLKAPQKKRKKEDTRDE